MCSLCSRLRRGVLYRVASELGATKIALGHHRDDMVQTLFMNMFFGGRLKGMPPKLVSDDGRHVVIRPLAYVAETRPRALGRAARVPDHSVHPVRQPGEPAARSASAQMLRDWEREHPGRIDRIFDAMARVVPSHLMDRNLFPFAALQPTGVADADGDRAFDDDDSDAPGRGRPRSRRRRAALRRRAEPRRVEEMSHDERSGRAVAAAALSRLRIAEQHRYRRLQLQPLARRARRRDLRLRAAAVAAGQPAAGADARGRGAARDRGRRLRSPRRKAARPTSPCSSARASPPPTARPTTTRSGTAACIPGIGRSATAATAAATGGPTGVRTGAPGWCLRLLGLLPASVLRARGRDPDPRQAARGEPLYEARASSEGNDDRR